MYGTIDSVQVSLKWMFFFCDLSLCCAMEFAVVNWRTLRGKGLQLLSALVDGTFGRYIPVCVCADVSIHPMRSIDYTWSRLSEWFMTFDIYNLQHYAIDLSKMRSCSLFTLAAALSPLPLLLFLALFVALQSLSRVRGQRLSQFLRFQWWCCWCSCFCCLF